MVVLIIAFANKEEEKKIEVKKERSTSTDIFDVVKSNIRIPSK